MSPVCMNNKTAWIEEETMSAFTHLTQDMYYKQYINPLSETKCKRKSQLPSQIAWTLLTYCFMPDSKKSRKDRYLREVGINENKNMTKQNIIEWTAQVYACACNQMIFFSLIFFFFFFFFFFFLSKHHIIDSVASQSSKFSLEYHARIMKVLSEGIQLWQRFLFFFCFDEGREDPNTK